MNTLGLVIFLLLAGTFAYSLETEATEDVAPELSLEPELGFLELVREKCGNKNCSRNEMCEMEKPPNCPGGGNCKPRPMCKKCCYQGCYNKNCRNGYCAYKEVTCVQAPCCPVATCYSNQEKPPKTCQSMNCPGRNTCKYVYKMNCNGGPKKCIYPTCSMYATGNYKYCPIN